MIEKPKYGWTNIKLNYDVYSASYLTDVPTDCLDSLINSFYTDLPFCVNFDTEGSYFTIICSPYIYDEVEVIKYENEKILITYENINFKQLCEEIYNDINDNLDDWVNWWLDEEDKDNKRKNELKFKLDELKCLMNKRWVKVEL